MKKLSLTIAMLAALTAVPATAKENTEMDHSQHTMNHSQHAAPGSHLPKEFGQAGFAAIAEIVALLSKDPKTDWSKVNINGLREHLLMMNQLVMGATVEEQAITNGRRFTVTGSEKVLSAIQTMVPAHAAELDKMDEFTTTTKLTSDGAVLEALGNTTATNAKIKGLGFFGLMAIGSHHQMHHLMMARGHGHH